MNEVYNALLKYALENNERFDRFGVNEVVKLYPEYHKDDFLVDLDKLIEAGKIQAKVVRAGIRDEKTGRIGIAMVYFETIKLI